ncbi:MAG: dephospho-CoA kinase [Acidobacteria bacterium]|nr:dephospho-CoA kinase [Acidobacteriota bacterium]
MLKVGLTGGIAAGKSTVGEIFVGLGAYLLQADSLAHALMQPGQPVYDEVVRQFGAGILRPDGSIDRPKLAEAAFGTEGGSSRIQELNHIVHPVVIQKQEEWMAEIGRRDPKAIAVVEAALMLEAGAANRFDRLIVVTCHPKQRMERWAKSRGVDYATARKEVTRRMAAQLPDEEKVRVADYVIDNSGPLERTRPLAEEVFARLQREAKEL